MTSTTGFNFQSNYLSNACSGTRLEEFWKFFATYFPTKVAQKFVDYFGYFWKQCFHSKTMQLFVEIWATFYPTSVHTECMSCNLHFLKLFKIKVTKFFDFLASLIPRLESRFLSPSDQIFWNQYSTKNEIKNWKNLTFTSCVPNRVCFCFCASTNGWKMFLFVSESCPCILTRGTNPNIFKMGPSRPLFHLFSSFSHCNKNYSVNFSNINWRKHRWFAWDKNPGPHVRADETT